MVLLPKLTSNNYHVIFIRTLTNDSSKYVFDHALQYMDMFISMHKENIGVSPGQIILLDASNYNFSFITKTNIITLKKFIQYIQVFVLKFNSKLISNFPFFFVSQDGLPVILRGVHLINVNPAIEKIITMCKPFIRNDLFKLVNLWSKFVSRLIDFILFIFRSKSIRKLIRFTITFLKIVYQSNTMVHNIPLKNYMVNV